MYQNILLTALSTSATGSNNDILEFIVITLITIATISYIVGFIAEILSKTYTMFIHKCYKNSGYFIIFFVLASLFFNILGCDVYTFFSIVYVIICFASLWLFSYIKPLVSEK